MEHFVPTQRSGDLGIEVLETKKINACLPNDFIIFKMGKEYGKNY
jgi:hypothetical protein